MLGDLNSGPHACMAGTLLSMLCPQALSILSNESFLSRIKAFFNQSKFIGGSKLLCAKISENLAACLEEFSVLWEKPL